MTLGPPKPKEGPGQPRTTERGLKSLGERGRSTIQKAICPNSTSAQNPVQEAWDRLPALHPVQHIGRSNQGAADSNVPNLAQTVSRGHKGHLELPAEDKAARRAPRPAGKTSLLIGGYAAAASMSLHLAQAWADISGVGLRVRQLVRIAQKDRAGARKGRCRYIFLALLARTMKGLQGRAFGRM